MCCVWICFLTAPQSPCYFPEKPGQTGKGPLSEARNSLVKLKVKVGRAGSKDPFRKGSTWHCEWTFWQVGALENKCKKLLQGLKAARAEMSVQAVSWQMWRRSHFPETRDDHHQLGSDMMIWHTWYRAQASQQLKITEEEALLNTLRLHARKEAGPVPA